MSEQSEREAYNEAAREYHEGKEREEMDRPMFTQRDVDAAVQGEREAILLMLKEPVDHACECGESAELRAFYESRIRSRTSPAVDVMAVVREYVEAVRYKGPGCVDRFIVARDALVALVAASPKAEKKENDNG